MTPDFLTGLFFLTPALAIPGWLISPRRKSVVHFLPTITGLGILACLTWFLQAGSHEFRLPFLSVSGTPGIDLIFLESPLRISLALLANLITVFIQVYSWAYLKKDDLNGYFHFLISVFLAAMAGLFLADSLFTLLITWELVGICSYLLVQFWFQKEDVLRSGIRVVMINKLGDVFLLSGVGLVLSFGLPGLISAPLYFPSGLDIFFQSPAGQVLAMFLIMAAFVKSAQFPFSLWLKEAMAGPTSVSALLHSATMVTAGVWVLYLLFPILAQEVRDFILVMGAITLLLANLAALFSSHLKHVLAFSTLAQLGLMTLAIGSGRPEGAVLHLFTHAFYKAGLFLTCGLLMHQAEKKGFFGLESQYIPHLEGALSGNKGLRIAVGFLFLSLAGMPLTAGFISKENLMPEVLAQNVSFQDVWVFGLLQIANAMTAFYSVRIFLHLGFRYGHPLGISRIPPALVLPVFLFALGSGFWLLGPNPFSTEGWLTGFWSWKGHLVSPDPIAFLLGGGVAWFMDRKNGWKVPFEGMIFRNWILDFTYARVAGSFLWKAGLSVSAFVQGFEKKALERPLDLASKTGLVAGYFSAFTDRVLVDGVFTALAAFSRETGAFIHTHTHRYPQYVVWFSVTALLILIYFSYYL